MWELGYSIVGKMKACCALSILKSESRQADKPTLWDHRQSATLMNSMHKLSYTNVITLVMHVNIYTIMHSFMAYLPTVFHKYAT